MSDKEFNMLGAGEPVGILDALSRAAEAAAREEDRWLSADELADMLGVSAQNIRNECIRLLADGKILVKVFRRGCAQQVPRFRVVLSGIRGGDVCNSSDTPIFPSSPLNDPSRKIKHRAGYHRGAVKGGDRE